MMVETHMLKPYKSRVEGTYEIMKQMISIAETDGRLIKELRAKSNIATQELVNYPIQWEIDTTKATIINFKGFEADTLISEVTGFPRLKYDQSRPFTKEVVYQNYYKPSLEINIPNAYIIKKSNYSVIDLLANNEIAFTRIKKDTVLEVEAYRIEEYETNKNSYEGHYPHYNTKVSQTTKKVQFNQGDVYVPTRQLGIRYIIETLEPSATDSFFNWNFFDAILQQKEGFSPYVFEDIALELLKNNKLLNEAFQLKKSTDESFANDWHAQLSYIYHYSDYYEDAHMQYPVYRVLNDFQTMPD